MPEKEFVFFNGGCPRHLAVTLDDALKAKELHPHAELLVHPECRPDVVAEADYVGSTTGIMAYARKSEKKNLSSVQSTVLWSIFSMSALIKCSIQFLQS